MKFTQSLLTLFFILLTATIFSQTNFKPYHAGNSFDISLPDYMTRTIGLNSSSALEYKNEVKEVYGFVIIDNKEELALADMVFSSINEFYDDFIKDFLKDEENKTIANPQTQKKGDINFIESEATYYDKDAKLDIYYLIGVVETKKSFYKILSWTSKDNKDKFKADFQKILYSLKD